MPLRKGAPGRGLTQSPSKAGSMFDCFLAMPDTAECGIVDLNIDHLPAGIKPSGHSIPTEGNLVDHATTAFKLVNLKRIVGCHGWNGLGVRKRNQGHAGLCSECSNPLSGWPAFPIQLGQPIERDQLP